MSTTIGDAMRILQSMIDVNHTLDDEIAFKIWSYEDVMSEGDMSENEARVIWRKALQTINRFDYIEPENIYGAIYDASSAHEEGKVNA